MKLLLPLPVGLSRSRPPHGGRGLKLLFVLGLLTVLPSPPSRGAWIEILFSICSRQYVSVAPLTGGVD